VKSVERLLPGPGASPVCARIMQVALCCCLSAFERGLRSGGDTAGSAGAAVAAAESVV
jgi:hypothetical protein